MLKKLNIVMKQLYLKCQAAFRGIWEVNQSLKYHQYTKPQLINMMWNYSGGRQQ